LIAPLAFASTRSQQHRLLFGFNTFSATSIAFRLQHVLSNIDCFSASTRSQQHRLLFGFNTLSIGFNMSSIGFNTLFLSSNRFLLSVFNTHFPPLVFLAGVGSVRPWHFFS
jgi:hypothetical protein